MPGRLARAVDLFEHQGKELFAKFGIPVSDGRLATTPEEARSAAEELGPPVVVKAQVLIGGRGKAGGIKLAETVDDAEARAREILGMDIRGHTVGKLWIERASEIAREYYLSLALDRSAKKPLFMFTTQGGVDIEEVAATTPDALVRLHVDPLAGCQPGTDGVSSTTAGSPTPASRSRSPPSSAASTPRSSAARRCSARSTR